MTRPDRVVSSVAGTLQRCAAAAISVWRTAAPTWRSGVQFCGVEKLPAASCDPYFAWSASAISMVTLLQSTSSSSAMIIGSMFITPWPTSGFLLTMVTLPSAAILTKAFGCIAPPPPPGPCANRSASRWKATTIPPPASALTRRKERRSSVVVMAAPPLFRGRAGRSGFRRARGRHGRRAVNGLADAHVGAAPAEIAVHRRVDVVVRGLRRFRQQRCGRHDLTRLAVAALWDVELRPRALQGMRSVRREPFDRDDRGVADGRHRRRARPHGVAAQVHGARAALADAAAELGPLQVEDVSEHPQQGHVAGDIDGRRLPVHVHGEWHSVNSQQEREIAWLSERCIRRRPGPKSKPARVP